MNKQTFNVYGVPAVVRSDSEAFLEFVAGHYSHFTAAPEQEPLLHVEFSRAAGEAARARSVRVPALSADLRAGPSEVYWENEFGFSVHIEDRGSWYVQMYHFDLTDDQPASRRYENYQRSMRWGIHYPLFSLLRLKQDKHLTHSSAVARDGRAYLITGLNGVGKSTLAAYLATYNAATLLTDNYILSDARFVYPFPERLRLAPASLEKLDFTSKASGVKVYNKWQMSIDVTPRPLILGACFLLTKGEGLSVKQLPGNTISAIKGALDDYLQEYPEYSYMGPWLGLRGISLSSAATDDCVLRCPWYLMQMPHTWNLKAVAEVIKECM